MNRELIKVESDNYVLEELVLNKELIFYKKDKSKIDIEVFRILYMKYAFQRTLLNDDSSDNDIRFTYIDNYVKVNLISFKKRIKLFKEPIQ